MGYRSQVAIAFKKEIYHQYENTLKKHIKDCDQISQTEGATAYIFTWDDVKWYPSYEDVRTIMNVLAECEEEDYGFVRVGEEAGDVEELGSPAEYEIEIHTHCSVNLGYVEELTHDDFFAPNSIKFIKEDN